MRTGEIDPVSEGKGEEGARGVIVPFPGVKGQCEVAGFVPGFFDEIKAISGFSGDFKEILNSVELQHRSALIRNIFKSILMLSALGPRCFEQPKRYEQLKHNGSGLGCIRIKVEKNVRIIFVFINDSEAALLLAAFIEDGVKCKARKQYDKAIEKARDRLGILGHID